MGSVAFAKIWREDPAHSELKSIWAHEVRSSLRLGGLPRAEEVFVRLRELGPDPLGYVVILDVENREPLSMALADRGRHPWLRDIKQPRTRRRLWQGLLRVARGLAMMHTEGTLHRMLGADNIYTDLDGACDFRLSGFEWSLRIASPERSGASNAESTTVAVEAPELRQHAAQYSVASDWFTFGLLLAQVAAGIPQITATKGDRLGSLRKAIEQAYLTPPERKLITDLIDPDPEKRMWHASDITETIDTIVELLAGDRETTRRPLYVGFNLSRESELSRLINKITNGSVLVHDTESQLAFINDDLGPEPRVTARLRPFPHYVLHGGLIDYQLRRWSSGAAQSWNLAVCARHDNHPTVEPTQTFRAAGRRIEMRSASWVAENLRSVKSLSDPWDEVLPLKATGEALSEDQRRIVNFFRVTNQLEALLNITQIWPVLVIKSEQFEHRHIVCVTPVTDVARQELAKLLGVPAPAELMKRLFQLDEMVGRRSAEDTFVFSDEGRLFRREVFKNVRWRFVGFSDHETGPRYSFAHDDLSAMPPAGMAYLRPADLAGSSVLLHRRKKAIDDLTSHRALLDALDDPSLVKRTTVDVLKQSEALDDLDPSKQVALREIWRSQPFYALQGPPGTGKTTLVARMAVEQVTASPSTQILIAAHSHETVENVMEEVLAAFPNHARQTVAVRLDSEEENGIRARSAWLASELARSDLVRRAPAHIRERIDSLCHDNGPTGAAERGGFEHLVRDGAGIVFSTSNSGELARLIESGRRYDWSIIEEAGRAHGFDLAMPLQASHRVLLIGDQQQLPAFNLEVLDALLGDHERVLAALYHGMRYAPTLIERYFVTAASTDLERFRNDCAEWRTLLPFFKTVFHRCELAGSLDGEPIARQLTHQHRMHPDIKEIVAECFYPDLETAPEALLKFESQPDPFAVIPNSWMPEAHIVFVDVPWVQQVKHAKGEHTRPRYTAPVEADAVVDILGQFCRVVGPVRRPEEGLDEVQAPVRPTLQILSPYRAQVNRIRRTVHTAISQGKLQNLQEFDLKGVDGAVAATVDEFQGNQADIIVVSLVRNNHAKRGTGLGFLADGRRLNVLLSRAKRKLVLIGSWNFLLSRFSKDAQLSDDDPMADFARVMRALDGAIQRKTAERVSLEFFRTTPTRQPHLERLPRRRSRQQ